MPRNHCSGEKPWLLTRLLHAWVMRLVAKDVRRHFLQEAYLSLNLAHLPVSFRAARDLRDAEVREELLEDALEAGVEIQQDAEQWRASQR